MVIKDNHKESKRAKRFMAPAGWLTRNTQRLTAKKRQDANSAKKCGSNRYRFCTLKVRELGALVEKKSNHQDTKPGFQCAPDADGLT
jgi:hypothetical protein